MKYAVINAKGKVLGKYLTRDLAESHVNYIIRHGGYAEVRPIA